MLGSRIKEILSKIHGKGLFYNGVVVLQYLVTISVFFRRSKTLLTHFLSAYECLFFVTICNDIHM